jgi:chitinase
VRKIFLVLLIAVMAVGVSQAPAANKIVVGYYYPGGSYTYTSIRYDCLTVIAHAFIEPNTNGSLNVPGGFLYPQLITQAHARNVKVVVSVGGYGAANTAAFVAMAADTTARHKFVSNLFDFCMNNGYDGADLDWEYPAAADKANFTALVHELRTAFNVAYPAFTLSIATSASGSSGFDVAATMADFDWIGLMTYDFYGTWTAKAGPNSPLYGTYGTTDQGWIDNSVANFFAKSVPPSKLLIGIAFYGWQYKTSALYAGQTGGASAQTQATQKQYQSFIGNLQSGWTRTWDAATHTPYMQDAAKTTLISYDDSASISDKCDYIKSKNLGGAIVWAIGQDYTSPRQPLLETIGNKLYGITEVAAPHAAAATSPESFELGQNYPNPFNPSTIINFTLASKEHVTLAIYTVLGKEVARLAEGEMESGTHAIEWNAKNQPSGVYYYRLSAGSRMSVKTMVLQK